MPEQEVFIPLEEVDFLFLVDGEVLFLEKDNPCVLETQFSQILVPYMPRSAFPNLLNSSFGKQDMHTMNA